MRHSMRALAAMALMVSTVSMGLAGPASATSCETGWGSLLKAKPASDYDPLVNIRTGRHVCFDRMVFDVRDVTPGDKIGFRVSYVREIHQDGSGHLIRVRGGAVLEVRIAAPSYDPNTGRPVYQARAGQRLPGVDLTSYQTFRDARFVGSFEGDTQVGLGVRAKLPFRVFQVGDRLVVDVAHRWPRIRTLR